MEKRFQVFVSSTFEDLKEERQEVMHALLELDCIPSGMELFPAANETQWNLIKKVIEYSDYYVLIIGGRYGSIGPEGVSYSEMEYRYALSLNKPTIAFLHREPGKITAEKSEASEEGRAKLSAFRGLVEKKMCKHWLTPQDLGSVVSRSVIQLIKGNPAVGWVRADELPDRDATLELLRLREKVDELEAELIRTRTSAPDGTDGLVQGEDLFDVRFSFSSYEENQGREEWEEKISLSWNEMFSSLAPHMINESNERSLKSALTDLIEIKFKASLDENSYFQGVNLRYFNADKNDFQTIKIQLRALGLIVQNLKNRSLKDTDTYWKLTAYGDQIMTRLRAIRRGASS